ncbi:hypothetical protein [Peterkaempfera sp. SMS 1(5)a]|uniref:hypothetical protein n=1 Tax=Peterkaempfera podocarpi TaxID=3232308 RepID=UPI003672B8FF
MSPEQTPQHDKTETVLVWEDDPGRPPSVRTPLRRPVPDLSAPPLPVGVSAERPTANGERPGTPEFRYWAAAEALSRAAGFWGPLMPPGVTWHTSVGNTLTAVLDAGDDLNAYYDRTQLAFFHHTVAGITVRSCESPDVVCHETGHAVLDALRPQLWDAASAEAAALHESFGDMSAILSALQVEPLREAVLADTQGSIAVNSRLSRLAEQLGWAVRRLQPDSADADCLRNATNRFFYQDPLTLPPMAPATALASEPHSLSRVFTGAFLEALAGVFRVQQNRNADGLSLAAGIMGRLLVAGCLTAPVVPGYFAQVAAHMIAADQNAFHGEYGPALRSAFVRHGIVSVPDATAITPEAVERYIAGIAPSAPDSGESLTPVTLPGDVYGLTDPLTVRAPAQQPRFAVAGSDPVAGSLPLPAADLVATSFVEDLLRQGRVTVPEENLTPSAVVVDGAGTHTHEIARTEADGLTLLRRVFT